jgi:hypothetical protein
MQSFAMKVDPAQIEVVDDAMAEVLKRKQPAERIGIGVEIWLSTRRMLVAHLRHSHPDWDEKTVEAEVSRRLLHGSV